MKSMISFSFGVVMMIADSMGSRTKVNSSFFESKISEGKPAKQDENTCIASLQLNGDHICSSALFQKGFLLTAGVCAAYMLNGMSKNNKTGTAVLGDSHLKKGQRVIIFEILHTCKREDSDESIGVVMIADNVNYTHIKILDLYPNPLNFRHKGYSASVCGWDRLSKNIQVESPLGGAKHSDNLCCMDLGLADNRWCERIFRSKDFRSRLLCGQAKDSTISTTTVDIGSPLIKTIRESHEFKKYIIGVTIPPSKHKKGVILRFIRINYVLPLIERMANKLQFHEESDINYSSSSGEDCVEHSNKRPKFQGISSKNFTDTLENISNV